jgi:hypothetical protein
MNLEHYGVRRQTFDRIKSLLEGKTQQEVEDGERSSAAPVISGVPQSTGLDSLLFLMYIKDPPFNVK